MNAMRFAVASTLRSLVLGIGALSVGACGSRTPLDVDPQDGAPFATSPPSIDGGLQASCFTNSQLVGEIPIDLYFMMDKSSSLNMFDFGQTISRWTAVSRAMKTFINSPKSVGLGAGIAFFPRLDSFNNPLCAAADYAFPVVPVGVIPSVVPAITAGINAQTLAAGTPTTPALQGAHVYARNRAQAGRVTAVVIVTDGQPRQCSSSIESTAGVATQAASGNPSIKTYVLGVGPSLSALNTIAAAGGTGRAYLVESGGEADLTAALDAIRTSAQSCAYLIPEAGRVTAARTPAKVATRVGANGAPNPLLQVAGLADCGDSAAWYYERPSTGSGSDTTPTRVTLCPAACDSVVRTTGSHLDVIVGCDDAGVGAF